MRRIQRGILGLVMAIGVLAAHSPRAEAANYIVYFHGRLMNTWPDAGLLRFQSGWQHMKFSYDGNQYLSNASIRTTIKNTLATTCRNGNTCVLVCFSSGCNRAMFGLNDLAAAGTPATGMLWMESAASATGGTELVTVRTRWYHELLAGIIGISLPGREAVDDELSPAVMRGTFGYIQNKSPAPIYDVAGTANICKRFKILFFKFSICGNSYLPGGRGDGAVPIHSSCGFNSATAKTNCCSTGTKYTNHRVAASCEYARDHSGMFEVGVKNGSVRLAGTSTVVSPDFTKWEGYVACNLLYDDCDSMQDPVESLLTRLPGTWNATVVAQSKSMMTDSCGTCSNVGVSRCAYFSQAVSGYTPGPEVWECQTCADACGTQRACCGGAGTSYVCGKSGCWYVNSTSPIKGKDQCADMTTCSGAVQTCTKSGCTTTYVPHNRDGCGKCQKKSGCTSCSKSGCVAVPCPWQTCPAGC